MSEDREHEERLPAWREAVAAGTKDLAAGRHEEIDAAIVAIAAMRALKKVQGVSGEEVARWIDEERP